MFRLFFPGLILVALLLTNMPALNLAAITTQAAYSPEKEVQIRNDVLTSTLQGFQLYQSLLNDIISIEGYQIPLHAADIREATAYLSPRFEEDLAFSIAAYYLQWQKDIDRVVLISTDSIPVVTPADIPRAKVFLFNDTKASVQCMFSNCYWPGDSYLYEISLRKSGSQWKIYALSWEQSDPNSGPNNKAFNCNSLFKLGG